MFKRRTKDSQSREATSRRTVQPRNEQRQFSSYYAAPQQVIEDAPTGNRRRILSPLRIIMVLLVVILVLVVWVPSVNIKTEPKNVGSGKQYQRYVDQLTGGLLDHFRPTLNIATVTAALQTHYPEISSIRYESGLPFARPALTVSISQPALVLSGQGGTYVIGSNGKAITAINDGDAQYATLPQVEDASSYPIKLNKQALSSDQVNFIQNVYAQLRKSNVVVTRMVLPPAPQELDVFTDKPYLIKFNTAGNPLVQAGTYLALRNHFDKSSDPQPQQYVDVRVEEKAFVK